MRWLSQPPRKGVIEEGENKGTIHEGIYIQVSGARRGSYDLFVGVAGVAPDILISLLPDTAEMCEAFGGVEDPAAEGDTV